VHRGMTCLASELGALSSRSPNHHVSSFRGLPQKAAAPNAELSRLRLAKPPSKSGSLARTCGDGKAPAWPRTAGGPELIAAAKS
jgi:hypothetical protein